MSDECPDCQRALKGKHRLSQWRQFKPVAYSLRLSFPHILVGVRPCTKMGRAIREYIWQYKNEREQS